MRWALLASYPLLAHFAVTRQQPWFEWAALIVLFAGIFQTPLRKPSLAAWIAFLFFALADVAVMMIDTQRYALFLPPLVLPAMAAASFALSLRPGQTALITRMATLLHGGSLQPELKIYTRYVTWLWLLFLLAAMGTEIGAALLCSRETWSLVSNLYGYLAMGALFALEYLYRRIRYRNLPHPKLANYVKIMSQMRIDSV